MYLAGVDGNDMAGRAVVRGTAAPESLDPPAREANCVGLMHVTVEHVPLELRLEKLHAVSAGRAVYPFARPLNSSMTLREVKIKRHFSDL